MAINGIDLSGLFGTPHGMATNIAGLWSKWDAARSKWKDRIKEIDEYLYATSTADTTNDSAGFNHTTHRPKLTQIYDNLKANYYDGLIPNRDWLTFVGNNKEALEIQKRKLLLGYLKTKHRLSKFNEVIEELLDDWVSTGNCFAGVYFSNEKALNYQGIEDIVYAGPKVFRISPHDIVFNPLATDFRSTGKIVRSIKTLADIARDIEERPELGYYEEVFRLIANDRAIAQTHKGEDVNKYHQMQYDGFGTYNQYLESGSVEILDFYGDYYDVETMQLYKNSIISVVDRRYVIRHENLTTWDGKPHIYHCGWRKRRNNLWAMGPLDNLIGLQYRINHLENARANAFDAMLNPDRVIVGDVEIEDGPGGSTEYWINDQGSVQNLGPDTTVLNADFQIRETEEAMELYAGAPREAMGFRTAGEKTKFEVSTLMNAAGRIFQNKMTRFESHMLEMLVNAEVEVARSHFQTTDTVEAIDPDTGAVIFNDITKGDLMLDGRVIPVGARHFAKQQRLAQDLMSFQQGPMTDQEIAQHFPSKRLAKIWEEVMGLDEFDLFEEYGRIPERLEAARLNSIAQKTMDNEDAVDTETDDTLESDIEDVVE